MRPGERPDGAVLGDDFQNRKLQTGVGPSPQGQDAAQIGLVGRSLGEARNPNPASPVTWRRQMCKGMAGTGALVLSTELGGQRISPSRTPLEM